MAVDTAAKRASALNAFSLGLVLPIPDGTIDQADRQHVAGLYGGLLAAGGGFVPYPHPLTDNMHGGVAEGGVAA